MSVVIPALNARRTIGRQLAALDRQNFDRPYEVIVADNGSRDGTLDEVRRWEPSRWTIRCVDAIGRLSAARARNVGAAAARADRLAFCDADDEVGQDWLRALVETAPKPGVFAGGRMDEKRLNDSTRREHFGEGDGLPVAWWFLPAASGGNLLVWKSDFDRLGGFDDMLPYPTEDTDFCWRAQLGGLELRYAPEAVVHYRHRQRAASAVQQAFRYGVGAARLLDCYRDVPGVPAGSPFLVRTSMLLREVRRSVAAKSAAPILVQITYELAFSGAKLIFLSKRWRPRSDRTAIRRSDGSLHHG